MAKYVVIVPLVQVTEGKKHRRLTKGAELPDYVSVAEAQRLVDFGLVKEQDSGTRQQSKRQQSDN